MTSKLIHAVGALCLLAASLHGAQTEIKDLTVNGGIQDGKARLVIEALLHGPSADRERLLFSTEALHSIQVTRERLTHAIVLNIEILQGDPKELPFVLSGEAEIRSVTGEGLQDWSVRQETNGTRVLVLRPRKADKPVTALKVTVAAERDWPAGTSRQTPLTLVPPQAALFHGYVRVVTAPELQVAVVTTTGLVPVEPKFLPETMRGDGGAEGGEVLGFRFHGAAYALPLDVRALDPEMRRVVLQSFRLDGRMNGPAAAFTLTAVARVKNPRGGVLPLLSGGVALTELDAGSGGRLRIEQGQYVLAFDRAGEFPVRVRFHAAVRVSNGWSQVDFKVAPSALQPVSLEGLGPETQFEFVGGSRPERVGERFVSHLPPDGVLKLAWKEARPEAEGKLFYAAEMLGQVSIGSGLLRQVALVECKVMQGELNRLVLVLRGAGNVTRVQGANVLSWAVEPGTGAGPDERRLVVQFNQAQKETFTLLVQLQRELGAFPQAVDAVLVRPEGATRFAGHLRVVNEGAVRLEVVQASGLSQVSPEQFPETDATKAVLAATGQQRFAFRFSSAEFALRVQADHVLPELSVSQVLAYHLGENELGIDAEVELDVREAPIRDLILRVPKGYAVARLNAAGLSDYFLREPADTTDAELRLVYAQPASGRQVIQLRLERNAALGQASWVLPRVEVTRVKSTRGHVGISADAGYRLTAERTQSLTETATAFFPRKLPGIQASFRISDAAWEATLRVERLPQSVQADVLHLFSIGEGIAYGSSTMNYVVSGAPIGTFRVELSEEYFNVEFSGKDVRHWQKTTNGYVVQLHTPVAGTYTLLATYERPFKAQGDTLTFTGARPVDAQSEQGHTLVVSAYQFQVTPANVSAGLLPLETAEVPSEYRLFFDAPLLAAYRYTARPFNLQLALKTLTQGETLGLVVDRAALVTRISKDGEVLTDVRYLIKNRGNPHFRVRLPAGVEMWSATVNGATVVPVKDGGDNLVPLPTRVDPNTVQTLELKLATRSPNPRRIRVAAPVVAVPLLLGEWRIEPDTGRRLAYHSGTLAPVGGVPDPSGFAQLTRMMSGPLGGTVLFRGMLLGLALVMTLGAWAWASGGDAHRFGFRHLGGAVVGGAALVLAAVVFLQLLTAVKQWPAPQGSALAFLAPVQQAGSEWQVTVGNEPANPPGWSIAWRAWPAWLALVVWIWGLVTGREELRPVAGVLGWTLLAWAALRWPQGLPAFVWVVGLFLVVRLIVPAGLRWFRVRPAPPVPPLPPALATPAPASALWWLGGALALGLGGTGPVGAAPAAAPVATRLMEPVLAELIQQTVRVEDKFVFATARVRWTARRDQLLTLAYEPAVVTRANYPTNAARWVQSTIGSRRTHHLLALQDGVIEVEFDYQLHVARRDGESGFVLPNHHGVVNRLDLTLTDQDGAVSSPAAVSVEAASPAETGAGTLRSNAVYRLVLMPVNDAWIGWKPRSRDVAREKAVFFAELFQLYVPAAGVVEGVHQVQIRPAQGELAELVFDVPAGATVSDVTDALQLAPAVKGRKPAAPLVSLWRFDPDTRKLRVSLSPAQSRPFTLYVRTQVPTGPLPADSAVGLLAVQNAAGQLGAVGLATGPEVQLDTVTADGFGAINLEDFPGAPVEVLSATVPGLSLRRAFRHADPRGTLRLRAAPVEADVRVETQETLSLGEDRAVLAVNFSATITRAGIFRLSFPLPAGFEVEAISGGALSHWTELRTADSRIITLHLQGRTEGVQNFAVSLLGPGSKAAKGYAVPRFAVREAAKQRGQLVLVPEQGLRLQIQTRDGVTQLDPQKSGIRQKGVMAFRLLQSPWSLVLDLEQVDPWVQVSSLQHVTVTEAQVKVAVNLNYQVENTGLKTLRVRVPTNAESVRFRGEQMADYLPVAGPVQDGLQTWEIKLHRRILGKYLLQLTWQTPLVAPATNAVLAGVQAADVNLQRGFVTLQSSGRLQVRPGTVPVALQPAEWQSIPRVLQQDIEGNPAHFTFRLVEPAWQLALQLERHEPARLLPARVRSVTLTSVVSDEGVMLTEARLELVPGDKRLLRLALPGEARFWFAFVNQNGVWPWKEGEAILIPLEQQSQADKPTTVELFFSSRIGRPGGRSLDLQLAGPRFDLPLENITWNVYLNEKWRLEDWDGTLQLQEETSVLRPVAVDVQTYLQNEANLNRDKTRQAEQLLSMGNSLLEKGDPQQARRAFQSAYGLSTHDTAFNEDARVQLHNLKLQQALVGLNVRQSAAAGDNPAVSNKAGELRQRKDVTYTQQEAKQIIDSNTAEDNAALLRLAERLVQQQDAAVTAPAGIRATIPQQGRLLTFRRAVQVDTQADLRLALETRAVRPASGGLRIVVLGAVFVVLGILSWCSRRFLSTPEETFGGLRG